ncbi:MAG: nitrilase-related carbon-nitrogen hydrolase [Acidimicrobiia bacterium]
MTTHRNGSLMRVAVTQFASTQDVDANLATCLRMIQEAAGVEPDLIVLPEFCNHLSVYDSEEHCRNVALDLDGPWLGAIADASRQHGAMIVLAVTLRHPDGRVTISNVMIHPEQGIVETADKQVLMGNERTYLTPGTTESPIIDSAFGPLAMYSCMEGVVFEPPMSLALRGARLLTNSLNSFGLDEASLHIPVRAVENRVFIAAANKVGPLIPEDRVQGFAEAMGIPTEMLDGAGESQIVAPDGTVLAMAPRTGEAVMFADLDLSEADSKQSAAGVDVYATRRPELYGPLTNFSDDRPPPELTTSVEAIAINEGTTDSILGLLAAESDTPRLVVLPERFGSQYDPSENPSAAVAEDADTMARLVSALSSSPGTIVVTSAVTRHEDGLAHTGVVMTSEGAVATQHQMHYSPRTPWATHLGQGIVTVDLEAARLALVVGDDILHPESFRLSAIDGASVVCCPTSTRDEWMMALGFAERAAENRVNVIAASDVSPGLGSVIAALPPDFTLWLPDRSRPFDGTINMPDVETAASHGLVTFELFPGRATNRFVSAGTDLVGGRPVQGAGTSVANVGAD